MTLFLFIVLSIAIGWLGLAVLCCLSLAGQADKLITKLAKKNKHNAKPL
jgi:hypothetical protein